MTSLDKIEQGRLATTGSGGITRARLTLELTETLKLAVPIALTQLGQIAMMTTDLALIGRLGDEAVAAAALAHTVFFVAFTFGMGLVSAVAPLAAQAFGGRNPRRVRRALRVGLWAALLISLPMMVLPLFGERILLMLGQAQATAHLAQKYLLGLAWGIPPALSFLAIRGFMGAVNRPEPGLWITLAAIPANALLVWLLIHGAWGLPRLELFGAGLATTIVNFGMFLAGLWFAAKRRPFRKYRVLGRIWRIDWALMRQLVVIGAPISIAFLLEYGLFGAAALLMGLIGTTALAAHQIALQIVAILFMVPFGIGMAATVRVGHAVGRGDTPAVRRAGFVATLLGIVFMSVMTLAVILGRFAIARFSSARLRKARAPSSNSLRHCCWSAPPSSSPTASRPSPPARFAVSTTRACRCCSPRSATGWSDSPPPAASDSRPGLERSASGSACPVAPRFMRCCSFYASGCSRIVCG
jgi:MATE family multidrug resistance protein